MANDLYTLQSQMHKSQNEGLMELLESDLASRLVRNGAAGEGITLTREELILILQVLLPVIMQPAVDGLISGK